MTPLPLTLIFRLTDYWNQLSEGTREGIVSGLIVALVVAAVSLLWRLMKTPRQIEPTPDPVPGSQEVKVKVEVVSPAPAPTAQPEPPRPFKSPDIPRPPLFGFVARRGEDGRDIVERLKEELAPEKNQLIVLWGSGGVGKTTLAAEACRALVNLFPGGIAWISADGKPEFGLSTLLDEIATHLRRPELRQLAPQPKDQSLHDALVDSPTPLIVLDNFETISPPEQDACAAWLAKRASCPGLITSRDVAPHARSIHILAMSLNEATEFLKKLIADARKPKAFEELDHNRLIQAADCIPLVMEWLVKQIDTAREPKSVLEDLVRGRGDAAQRVFDQSFELEQTGDDGRATLLALSLFVPSASRDGLAEVSGFGNDLRRLEKALQQLDELWLIETTQQNQRVSVQGLTRQLARARLSQHPLSEDFLKRFVSYIRDFVEGHEKISGEDYRVLESERDNILSALDAAGDLDDYSALRSIVGVTAKPVTGLLGVRGYWDEGIKRNTQALAAARRRSSKADISVFAHNLAVSYSKRGEFDNAERLYEESLEINRALNDEPGISISLHELGRLAQSKGDYEKARILSSESLDIARRIGLETGVASSLHQLGLLAQARNDLAEARRLFEESLEIEEKLDNSLAVARTTSQLGIIHMLRGEISESQVKHEKSLAIRRSIGDQAGIATDLHQLGMLAEEERKYFEASRLFREALAIWDSLGAPETELVRHSLERVEGKSS